MEEERAPENSIENTTHDRTRTDQQPERNQAIGKEEKKDDRSKDRAREQSALHDQLKQQYQVRGGHYHRNGRVAFIDHGEKLSTASNDERHAQSMADLAHAKGWEKITVKGHEHFRHDVWLAASLRGIAVEGYKPTEQDLEKLVGQRRKHEEKSRETGAPRQKQSDKRVYEGRLVSHGTDRYNHDPEEKMNYFAVLQTKNGEEKIWGVDIKRAIEEGKAQTGDNVRLEYKGQQRVTVTAPKRDERGKVVGYEEKETQRNEWQVTNIAARRQVIESVADEALKHLPPDQRQKIKTAVNEKLNNREQQGRSIPKVPVYDKAAKKIERQKERSIEQQQTQTRKRDRTITR